MRQPSTESSSKWPADLASLVREALTGPDRDVVFERDPGERWQPLTNRELLGRIEAVAAALRARGLSAGDRVALISANRVDWIVANLGILCAGCVTVPIYATAALDQIAYILGHSGAKLAFVDTPAARERLTAGGIALDTVVFDEPAAHPASLATFVATGATRAAVTAEIRSDDLAVLIYTSGTTGTPKGVMLSHGNLASNASDAFSLVTDLILPGDPVLSVLPFAHIYEHTNILGFLLRGARIYVNRRVETLAADLREVRPVTMFGVPRIFERVYAAILGNAREAGGVKALLVPWAFAAGRHAAARAAAGTSPSIAQRLELALARALVLRRIPALLGCDRLRFFGSGSASLHPDIAYAFAGAGIRICEGYGLTECSPVVTANDPHHPVVGTVGRAIPNVALRLGDDGELFVRGPGVMLGYYDAPAETAAVLHDGWLATGDVATIGADGLVRIVDRKKEIFKTSGGKYISPARVEAALLRSPYAAQVVVLGSNRTHPAALISPNWPALRATLRLAADEPAAASAARAEVRAFLAAEAVRVTADLAPFEQIRWIGVLPRDLAIDDGELTPTLKVKRREVESRWLHLIPEYADSR